MLSEAGISWQSPADLGLIWLSLDGDFVLYQNSSGETHFLNAAGEAVLRLLTSRPLTEGQIAASVVAELGCAPDPALLEQVAQVIRRFDDLGLLRAVRS